MSSQQLLLKIVILRSFMKFKEKHDIVIFIQDAAL